MCLSSHFRKMDWWVVGSKSGGWNPGPETAAVVRCLTERGGLAWARQGTAPGQVLGSKKPSSPLGRLVSVYSCSQLSHFLL